VVFFQRAAMKPPIMSCLAALVLAACSPFTNTARVCTEIGCNSGIKVILESPPAGAYRIEAYVYPQGPRYVFRCERQSGCMDQIFLVEFTPYRLFIEVVSDSGTQRYEVVPKYQESRPNGPDCPPHCRTAVVRLPSDRLGT
jgi:hypothetical protein